MTDHETGHREITAGLHQLIPIIGHMGIEVLEVTRNVASARLPAALCAAGYYFWRRGILGTIIVGMAVYLPLHIGLGW